jgi:glutamine synthetase
MLSCLIKEFKKMEVELFLGVELEFYSHLTKENFAFNGVELKNEIGEGQIEVVFCHKKNIFEVLRNVILFRNKFKSVANFNAFIDEDTPPSALQFNLSIYKNGVNILNNAILYSILNSTKNNLEFFAPTLNCKNRLSSLALVNNFRNSPYTFCIGGKNNRTSTIRLRDGYFEHRLPSPSCKILKSFEVILIGILEGLKKKDIEIDILHSNAFEEEVIKEFNLIRIIDKT